VGNVVRIALDTTDLNENKKKQIKKLKNYFNKKN